jgi:hypothetical protein
MASRAEPGAQSDSRASLVRLGHLCFDDFLLLDPHVIAASLNLQPSCLADWSLALNNAPHIQRHFRLQIADCRLPESTIDSIRAAQTRLVHAFAHELLRAKAPPLYDALPWQDWDFSIVARRFKLWQTRFLLAGDGTTVAMCRCRKSAGVYVLEPDETIACYIERKAAIEKVRRFRLLHMASSPSPRPLAPIPLPDHSVDLAILGSCLDPETANWKLVTDELLRVAANVLLIENSPLAPPLPETPLAAAGFKPDSVAVSGLGLRRCWWKQT